MESIYSLIDRGRQNSGPMFRTHLGRGMDFSSTSNRLIVVTTTAMAVAGLALWLTGDWPHAWLAPFETFLIWALVRELDPDRHWTAQIAATIAGIWVLVGLDVVSVLALSGFLLAGRLVLEPVGLRPLSTDLAAMVLAASVISYTAVGWVAGSGIALAIYIDARMADEPRRIAWLSAVAAALGASAVATVFDALPQGLPSIRPFVVVLVGLLALIVVARDPLPVTSAVDHSPHKLMRTDRLHAARVLTVVLVFVAAILAGQEAAGLGPVIIAVAMALASDELARMRTPRQ